MAILESLWGILVLFFWTFVLLASLLSVVMVLTDLFRDRRLNGWAKAAWILFLVFVPLLTALVYLIARGGSMPERINEQAKEARDATDAYIRDVAGASPVDEIAKAKALLDAGAITEDEFTALKRRVVAGEPATTA